MIKKITLLFTYLISFYSFCFAQVTINNYSVNGLGQAQLSIQGQTGKYYLLHAQHSPTFSWTTSMTMGVNGTMVISEPAAAYPLANYTITEHDVANPDDIDGDGIDDVTEFNNMPTDAPINFADPIAFVDGATSIPDAQTFLDLATVNNVSWAPFLDGQLYVKFGILDRDTPQPKIYFINSNTYTIHANFFSGIGATVIGDDGSGEIVFNPNDILPNGVIGSYSFNFSFGDAMDFEATQRTYELLVANMPFLQNNMNHFIGQADENIHNTQFAADFVGSRIGVVLESDVFAEIDYIPFHEAEGYGFFKHMNLNETPGSRDIVLYDALPNSLPRVGGIITSVIQTPLSHVNLRAIQDNVPNAYIKDPLQIDSIVNLLGSYIYYKVENETFQIREATLAEVNDWYEELRPTEPQIPVRDLSITNIMPLDSIEFGMSTSFGAKCSNVATMRSFGFPNGTIPDGFGIPFYYYDEFMQFNNFYQEADVMINNPSFINDINFRTERLRDFRRSIKDAPMPQWMMDNLQTMHDAFPVGTAVRCRSSTNNEDLPGFSGAGLYTSKTQHLDEGHISKSIKQVYASMWNFRAFEERDFYRVDHFIAAMGVLCHSNFEEEKSNGVGISIDPIYKTDSTFYLNTQVGESLITNPDPNSVPEEILLFEDTAQGAGYLVLRLSNLVNPGELVMDQIYLDQMRDYLTVIHDEFALLYNVDGVDGFAMDIEYKVTAQDLLVIKQARPWVSFWADVKANYDLAITEIIDPQSSSTLGNSELITTKVANTGLNNMSDFDLTLIVDGQLIETLIITDTIEPFSDASFQFTIPQDFSTIGDYNISCIVSDLDDEYGNNDTLNSLLSKVHALDGELSFEQLTVLCGDVLEAEVIITNYGETTITDTQIEVVVNGLAVDTMDVTVDVPFEEEESVTINIEDNLQQMNNNITLNLLNVNGQSDGNLSNNSVTSITNLDSDYDIVTLIIDADDYPDETSWEIIDEATNQVVASGSLSAGTQIFSEDICLNYNSCFSLYVYDSFGDGICCDFGIGFFQVLDASGATIVFNNGEFTSEAQEVFCPNGTGCSFTTDINISNTTSSSADDGSITMYTSSGIDPFLYSINGGQTFVDTNAFGNLAPGNYNIFIQDATGLCSYQETVSIEACEFTSIDITATDATSVVTADGSIVISPTSGVAPYQYSIDGGQNFVSDNVFLNLPVGPYNIVVEDATAICTYEIGIPIEVDALSIEDEVLSNGIKLYPNPTTNQFTIEIESTSTLSEGIKIEVYDHLGRTIRTDIIEKDGSGKTTIPLNNYASGTYFIKCYNTTLETHFKVIKI
ncbi:T9SS type A sorting domain-containing protein [Flavobacteriales bacterium]|nr:T9SS type A sorting domain-containing protein [Flavobacteriales bacterium]